LKFFFQPTDLPVFPGEIMLVLICRQCRRQGYYSAKDFVGHFFICRFCRAANLLITDDNAVAPIPAAPRRVAPEKPAQKKMHNNSRRVISPGETEPPGDFTQNDRLLKGLPNTITN
jgi:hypothetical protein